MTPDAKMKKEMKIAKINEESIESNIASQNDRRNNPNEKVF